MEWHLRSEKKLLLAFCRSQQPLLLPHWCGDVRPLAQELLLLEATGHNSKTTSMMAAQAVADMCFDLQRPVAAWFFFAPRLSIWILEGWIRFLRLRPLFIYQVNYFRRKKQRNKTSERPLERKEEGLTGGGRLLSSCSWASYIIY